MSTRRTHILLPEDLIQEIDELVGTRGRSAFLVDTARNEVRRQRLLQFLQNKEAVWKDEDHPELAEGAAAWGRRSRAEDEASRSRKRRRGPEMGILLDTSVLIDVLRLRHRPRGLLLELRPAGHTLSTSPINVGGL